MAYLRLQDYHRFIAQSQIDEITDENDFFRVDAEPTAEEEAKSRLVQKYDVAREFAGVSIYDPTKIYNALSLVYLDGPLFAATATYSVNKLVSATDGNVYRSITGVTGTDPKTDSTNWQKLGAQYQCFNAIVPFLEWDWAYRYKTGVQVWYKNKTYTSLGESYSLAPDDVNSGLAYWGVGVAYTVPAGTILDPAKWQMGDTRCQRLVECVVYMTIEKLYKRTAAQNVPAWILKSYDESIAYLKDCANGEITPPLKELPNLVGHRLRISGNIKNVNTY